MSNKTKNTDRKDSGKLSIFFQFLIIAVFCASTPLFATSETFDNQLVVSISKEQPSEMAFSMLGAADPQLLIENITNSNVKPLGLGIFTVNGSNVNGMSFGAMNGEALSPADQCAALIKKALAEQNLLMNCSPNYTLTTSAVPNDPQYNNLWGLNANQGIDAPGAWDVHTGSNNVVIAVIDTGIDYNHPDLAANMWRNPGEICGNGIDDDGNGIIDDCYGYNAINNSGNPMDGNGHGTHCAGTIAARGNNGQGVAGVNWNAKLMAIKFLADNGSGSLAAAIQGINYMVMMKNRGVNIRVSNNSWGGGGYSGPLRDAIQAAINAGIIFVAAAGNSANDNDANPSYPASYENVVSVAAIDSNRNLASFSNYGASSVHIGAPGVSILSTYRNGAYASLSGTSMAAPHVAGLLALLHAANPGMTNAQLINRIYESGIPLATLNGLVSTGRMISASRALKNQTSPVQPPPGESTPCQYSMQEIAYAPDTMADNAEPISQGDELNYKSVNIQGGFMFYNQVKSSLVLSLNGIIYFGGAPNNMDYRHGSTAPLNSIAALHTDLIATSNPYGVRYAANSSKTVLSWFSKAYGQENLGDVEAYVVLHNSGIIDSFVKASTPALFNYIQERATMGITGPNTASAKTFAYNNIAHNQIAVRYTPNCSNDDNDGELTIHSFEAYGRSKNNKVINRAGPNGVVHVKTTGTGSNSNLRLSVVLDGHVCSKPINYNFRNGFASKAIKMPGFTRKMLIKLKNGEFSLAETSITNHRGRLARAKAKHAAKNIRAKNQRACNKIARQARKSGN